MLKNSQTTKYTATLPLSFVNELKEMTNNNIIPSVNFAIREALEMYISKTKKELYDVQMKDAARDAEFIKRTLDTDRAFSFSDSEVGGEW